MDPECWSIHVYSTGNSRQLPGCSTLYLTGSIRLAKNYYRCTCHSSHLNSGHIKISYYPNDLPSHNTGSSG